MNLSKKENLRNKKREFNIEKRIDTLIYVVEVGFNHLSTLYYTKFVFYSSM